MEYAFLDSGEGDRRVRRTRTELKAVFLKALAEKQENGNITVSWLTEASGISRKTFYLHYRCIGQLLDEIADDMVRSLNDSFTGELSDDILTLYRFLDTDDAGVQKLLLLPEYREFREKLFNGIFSCASFDDYISTSQYPDITRGYMRGIIGIYYSYVSADPEPKDLKRLAAKAVQLMLSGIGGD